MYKVIYPFADLLDDNHTYNVGDTFPRDGVIVKKERYEELAGPNNKIGRALIQMAEEEPVAITDGEISTERPKAVKKASGARKRTK